VTLRFLGRAEVADVVDRMGATAIPPATARLGPVVSRLGRDTVVVPVAGLDVVAAAVSAATADVGQPPDPRPFTGHLTLARLRHRAACGVAGARIDTAFDVREVVLVDSRTTHDGPQYRVVARWPVGQA
jgi:2'-5' RNA ligase